MKKMVNYKGALLCAASVVTLGFPASVAQEAQDATEESDTRKFEDVIVVKGFRRSLEDALGKKKDADQILDAISAEDIGKLPDTNVAEALQRITGVQINRDLGEGSEITVRGFSQNRIEVNGQTQGGTNGDGAVEFSTLPSEVFGSLEVIKTPSADNVEGALGAIVRLNTRKPLDRKGRVISGSLSGTYAERADEWAPKANFLYSDRWDLPNGSEFGALFNVVHNERKVRQDRFFIRAWEPVNGFGLDLDGDGVAGEAIERDGAIVTDLQDGVFVPQQNVYRVRLQDRQNTNLTTALQWRPNEDLEIFLDASYTENKRDDTQHENEIGYQSILQNDGANGGRRVRPNIYQPDSIVVSADQTLATALAGEVRGNGTVGRGVNLNFKGNIQPVDRETTSFQLGADWNLTEDINLRAVYASSRGEENAIGVFTSSGIFFSEWPFSYFDITSGNDLPSNIGLERTDENGVATTALTDEARIDFTSFDRFRHTAGTYQDRKESFGEDAFQVDVDWVFGNGLFHTMEFGVRFAKREGDRSRDRGRDTQGSAADGTLAGTLYPDLEALLPGITASQPFDDLFDGASGEYVRDWVSLDPNFISSNFYNILDVGGITLAPQPEFGFDVEEETSAAYVKTNFEGELFSSGIPMSGNIGVRYVKTETLANGTLSNGGVITPFSEANSYDHVLPSANITFELQDDLFLRLAGAKAISRPRLSLLSPAINVNFFSSSGNAGNPGLEPEEVTQFDASLEYYFGEGNLLSIALFHKDFGERISAGFRQQCFILPEGEVEISPGDDGCAVGEDNILLSSQVNSGGATVKGLEIAYQQSLDFLPAPLDGFGAVTSYTYVDSDSESVSASGLVLPQEDLSDHSFNLTGYYEKGGFSSRLSYVWRSEFFDQLSPTNYGNFREAYGQLDGSVSYDINKRLAVSLEALNILNDEERTFQEIEERIVGYNVNDRRLVLGVRAKF